MYAGRGDAAERWEIPSAWQTYLVPQHYDRYGASEQEVWRTMLARMSELVRELQPCLHPDYVRGFRELIVPCKSIPHLKDIDEKLAPLGWRTVSVEGYIPAEVYAGLTARRIFPVSRNLRLREHLDFSPGPDLAHDLFGHIPMLVSAEHRGFFRRLAAVMADAQASYADRELYHANRHMAALRSSRAPRSRSEPARAGASEQRAQVEQCAEVELSAAEAKVEAVQQEIADQPSSFSELARMYLWSIEFGLMGSTRDFRLFGAGLLSSPSESRFVASGRARVVDYTLEVTHRDINFSDPQRQYFVVPDYGVLHDTLTRYIGTLDQEPPDAGESPRT